MRLSRLIDEASTELATVESVVGGARHVLDVAAEADRRAGRIAGRLRTAAVVLAAGVAVIGGAIVVKALLDHRRIAATAIDGAPNDDAVPPDFG